MNDLDTPFDIPSHWSWSTFSEVGEWTGGGTPSKRKSSYWKGNIPWVSPKDMKRLKIDDTKDHVTQKALEESATNRVPAGSILFVTRSGILERTLPTAHATVPVTINQDLKALTLSENVHPEFLLYYTRAVERLILRQCSKHGTTVASLESGRLYRFPFPLPPLPEQRRIVARIEELFSNLDAGVGDLETAGRQLERYRLSVLQAAVEGHLTADWRRTHDPEPADQLLERILEERRAQWEEDYRAKYEAKGKEPPSGWESRYSEPESCEIQNLSDLPDSWLWTNIDHLTTRGPQNGLYLPKREYGSGTPILRIDDFQNGWSRHSNQLQKVRACEDDVEKYSLELGDLVVNRVNSMSHLGKCLLIDDSNVPSLFESNMMRLHLASMCDGKFVEYYLRSPIGRQYLIKDAKHAVNQASINQGDVKSTPVPLPPRAEQKEIVEQVERLLSVADDGATTVERERTRADRLRQSILKQAFSGRLVPHEIDEHDRPEKMRSR